MQLGAEIYGHAGLEADVEVQLLAIDCLQRAGVKHITVDMANAQLVRGLLAGVVATPEHLAGVHAALAAKDAAGLKELTKSFPAASQNGLNALVTLYGDVKVLAEAEKSHVKRVGAIAGYARAAINFEAPT